MSISSLIPDVKRVDDKLVAHINHAHWAQGRTTYGGLSAALAYHAAKELTGESRALRSAMVNFVGPCGEEAEVTATTLRAGKNATNIRTELMCDGVHALEAVFLFADDRDSAIPVLPGPAMPDVKLPPNKYDSAFPAPPGLNFFSQMEVKLNFGFPFSNSDKADCCWWVRLKNVEARNTGTLGLIAIADMLPPPISCTLPLPPVPLASMNWQINVLRQNPTTRDGWWLLRATSESAFGGYSSQDMTIWNADGECVIKARQMVTVFA